MEVPQGDDSARTMVVIIRTHLYCRIAKRLFLLLHESAQQLGQSRPDAQGPTDHETTAVVQHHSILRSEEFRGDHIIPP